MGLPGKLFIVSSETRMPVGVVVSTNAMITLSRQQGTIVSCFGLDIPRVSVAVSRDGLLQHDAFPTDRSRCGPYGLHSLS